MFQDSIISAMLQAVQAGMLSQSSSSLELMFKITVILLACGIISVLAGTSFLGRVRALPELLSALYHTGVGSVSLGFKLNNEHRNNTSGCLITEHTSLACTGSCIRQWRLALVIRLPVL